MGAYLSEPVKEKASEDGGDPRFSYGASSMQGWRISQEDAHNCIMNLGDEAKLSLFAVYDGHGGSEVAQYTAQHFPQHIFKEKQSSTKTNFSEILEDAFLSFDQHLKQATVLHKLREMAGGGGKTADKDADPKEARMLQKEASMPLEQILAKYVHHRANTLLKERRRADGEEVSDDEEGEEEEEEVEEGDDDDDDDEDDDDDGDDEGEDEGEEDQDGEDDEKACENGDEQSAEKGKKNGENEAEETKAPKENGVVVNGNHESDKVDAEAEEAEADDEKPAKKPRFEMEEFGFKGASKSGKGGKGKGKKTLMPRVPIEASPAIQAKTESKASKTESKLAKTDPTPLPMKMDLEQQMLNGHSENENNENKEREQTRINGVNNTPPQDNDRSENPTAASAAEPSTDGTASALSKREEESDGSAEPAEDSKTEEKPSTTTTAKEESSNGHVVDEDDSKKTPKLDGTSSSSSSAETGNKEGEVEGANAEHSSSAGSSSEAATCTGSKRSRKGAPVRHVKLMEMNTEDDDSDDSEDDLEKKMMQDLQEPDSEDSEGDDLDEGDADEDDDEENVDDDDGDDDDEEADDDDDDEDYEDIQGAGEEPGFDSGCTACVSLLVGNELFVANVGDSRCVVSREGEAVDMSFDHKPTDEVETNRISKAGGKVTEDGRVNGGLNLSRALGDHSYKNVSNLSDREQMISALPDIKSMALTPQDEFMVIACDGIWNSLTSQEVIDFVKMRIDHEKELTMSQICEELFDHCLAPHTMGDGTGCDNMTCIIVRFDSLPAMTAKRSKADSEETEDVAPSGKRLKLDGCEETTAA